MSGITEHCYEIGLWIYHTNWICCTLDYDSELCLVISILFLVHLYTCRLPDSIDQLMRNTAPVHDIIWRLYIKVDVTLSELKNPLLYNTFNWFHNDQTAAPFIFLFTACYKLDSGQPAQCLFLVSELFMS